MKRLTISLIAGLLIAACAGAAPCPPEGSGGDVALNRLKNRIDAPASYREMTVPQFLEAFTPDLHTARRTDGFSVTQTRHIGLREQQGIALVGYLIAAKQSGPEACNCRDPARRDFHIWIAARPASSREEAKALRAEAVIVEPTPNGQAVHANWRLRLFERLARDSAKVRVSGWAMYDPEHPDQFRKTRGTLWEVHPVMKIEFWSQGGWRPF